MTFSASATFMDGARYVPAEIMLEYKLSIKSDDNSQHPLVIFLIFVIVFTLSPGFILSGL